jgi:hypothetical protein
VRRREHHPPPPPPLKFIPQQANAQGNTLARWNAAKKQIYSVRSRDSHATTPLLKYSPISNARQKDEIHKQLERESNNTSRVLKFKLRPDVNIAWSWRALMCIYLLLERSTPQFVTDSNLISSWKSVLEPERPGVTTTRYAPAVLGFCCRRRAAST